MFAARLVAWVLVSLLIVSALAGCMRKDDPTIPGNEAAATSGDTSPGGVGGVPVWVDPATGCQYLGYTGHGLTPRLKPDGSPMCPGPFVNPVTGK